MKQAICALGALGICALGEASAQNNQFAAQPVIGGITTNEVIAILQSATLTAALIDEDQNGVKTIEASSGDNTVYVALRDCQGAGAAAPCALVQPFGLFPAGGVTLDQINNYNINVSAVATAGLMPDNRGVIATKIYLVGGTTQNNLIFELALFFNDIDLLLKSVTPGVIARISYPTEALDASRAGFGATLKGRVYTMNAVGGGAPGLMTETIRAALDQRAKIAN